MTRARTLGRLAAALGATAALAAPASAGTVLNEINCTGVDWVELVNTSAAAADLSGWLLTDDPIDSTRADHRLVLASETIVPGESSLVVERGAGGFPFGISCGSDTIRLADAAGVLVDETSVPVLDPAADTWGRFPSGTGPWDDTAATKGAPNQLPAGQGGDQAAWLFDPGVVQQVALTLSPAAQQALATAPTEYQPGTLALTTSGGTYGPYSVGIRLKGNRGSFRTLAGKAAFKLRMDHTVSGQRLFGLRQLTFNNMVQDPTMTHEVLAYAAFRAAGIAASRTGYAFVHLNGVPYGLYLNLEDLDALALGRWYPSTRHLYEGEYGMDAVPGGASRFDVDVGDADRSDLEALIAAAARTPGAGWAAGMTAVADLEQMTRMWAVERYIGHWDGYSSPHLLTAYWPNNYFLHSDSAGRFRMLPWGTDQTWESRLSYLVPANGRLFARCMSDPACASLYRDAVKAVQTLLTGTDLAGLLERTLATVALWRDLDARQEHSEAGIAIAIARAREFVAVRPTEVEWRPVPVAPSPEPSPTSTPQPPPAVLVPAAAGPAPGQAVAATPTAPRPPDTRDVLRISSAIAEPGRVTTVLRVAGAGRVIQDGSALLGRSRIGCHARKVAAAAGTLRLSCRFSAQARRRLRARRASVSLTTTFVPASGVTSAETRIVTTCVGARVSVPRRWWCA